MSPLQIFPKHPDADDVYYINGAWAPAAITAKDKRFTEAELAAEYYRASFLHENSLSENDGYDGMPETRAHRQESATFFRFAALPHFDA